MRHALRVDVPRTEVFQFFPGGDIVQKDQSEVTIDPIPGRHARDVRFHFPYAGPLSTYGRTRHGKRRLAGPRALPNDSLNGFCWFPSA